MNLLKRFRSSRTGQWVTRTEADANEDTTVSETPHPSDGLPIIALIALRRSIRVNGLDNTLERLVD